MRVELESVTPLRFADGAPVRAASAVARLAGGWLVAQDDATSAAWLRGGPGEAATRLRLLPPVEGHDVFATREGTKALKPDLEAAVELPDGSDPAGGGGVLLLGSGSSRRRMRAVLVSAGRDGGSPAEPTVTAADLTDLYALVAHALHLAPDLVNLEGACLVGGALRWFQRGLPRAGLPTASVDVDLAALLSVARGRAAAADLRVGGVRTHDLGQVGGVGLAATDAVALPRTRHVLLSAAAEDTADPRDDGPVVGSALVLLDDAGRVVDSAPLPLVGGRVAKVEGLAIAEPTTGPSLRLLATVDADDPAAPSLALRLGVTLTSSGP